MKVRNNVLKKLGAIVFAAALTVGMLVPSVQPTEAASKAKYTVVKDTYSKDYTMDDGSVYFTMKGTFPTIKESSNAAKKINAALEKEKKRLVNQYEKELPYYIDEYKTQKAYADKEGYDFTWSYGDEITYKVTANNDKYFSVMLSGYLYTGGAHGTPYRSCLTFNAKTGAKLTAAKAFGISKAKLNQKVTKLYVARYNKHNENDFFFDTDAKSFKKSVAAMDFNNSFYVNSKGKAVFYVDPGVMSPNAAGFIQVSATIK